MNVDLKGSTFCLTGKLTTMTRSEALSAIEETGGQFTKSVTAKTDYMIVGERPSSKYVKAKNMGIPLLTEKDFKKLIKGKTIEVKEVGAAGSKSVDELLGEVRSAMQGAPSGEMWSKLVKLLDACRAEDVAVLTEYIDSYIARWTTESMHNKMSAITNLASDKNDPRRYRWQWYYTKKGHSGELRLAPEHWIGELQQGVDSEKYRVVRALDLYRNGMNSAAVVKLLKHPSLVHLETLILPENAPATKGLVSEIARHPTLKKLYLGGMNKKSVGYIAAEKRTPAALETLDLTHINFTGPGIFPGDKVDMLASALFKDITCLSMGHLSDEIWQLLLEVQRNELMTRCDQLHVERMGASDLSKLLDEPILARGLSLSIDQMYCNPLAKTSAWEKLFDTMPSHLITLLDFSNLCTSVKKVKDSDIAAFLDKELPDARLLHGVRTLALGKWKTPELTEQLNASHPELALI